MDKRMIFVSVLGVATLLLLFCTFTRSWYSQKLMGVDLKAGMWSLEMCQDDRCETMSLSKIADMSRGREKGKHGAFNIFGKITFFASLATILVLAGLAFLAIKKHDQAVKVAKIGLLVTTANVLAGLVFVINKPTILNASAGVWAFMIASLAAIVATAILAKPETYLVGGGRDPDVPRL